MNILFLCNTVYQLIGACRITQTFFSEDSVDVIISDHTADTRKIVDRINDKHILFNKAYWVETKNMYDINCGFGTREYIGFLKNDNATNFKPEKTYDKLLVANAENFSYWLFNYLKRKNKKLSLEWFEDGIGTYCNDAKGLAIKSNLKSNIRKFKRKLLKVYYIPENIEKIYLSEPELFTEPIKAEKISLLENCKFDESLKEKLNLIFDYESCVDKYEEKYIFFADAMCDYNKQLEVLDKYAVNLNKADLVVKRHPRYAENIFGKAGYKTTQDTSVPWEVIALNIDISNKVLITMYSSSTITPRFLFGMKYKSVILSHLDENFDPNKIFNKFAYENFYSKDENCTIVER